MKNISIKKNIIASYISQFYSAGIGIIVLPLYIKIMGAEAYGLVGFFSMLQAIFALLDLGLTPTISRETARFRAGALTDFFYMQLYRALNMLFMLIALVGGGALFISADIIASKWLNLSDLKVVDVIFALQVMAISVSLRWMDGLYRGVISGSEQLVWLSAFSIVIATLRFLIVFPVMQIWGATPDVFFTYQLVVAIIEYCGLLFKTQKILPKLSKLQKLKMSWSLKPLKPYISFAMSIAITSGLWVIVTQTDKLIMSSVLSLEDYGYFTLAVLVASGITTATSPISSTIKPRMANLDAQGKHNELIQIYRNSTQFVTVVAGVISIMLVLFADEILYVWTGDKKLVQISAPILQFYAIGYGVMAVGAFPYYLQYALGNLKLQIIGSILFMSMLLPLLWLLTNLYGMLGAGYAWAGVNIVYFFAWTAIVHSKFAPKLHFNWLTNDILKLLLPPVILGLISSNFLDASNRYILFFQLFFLSINLFLISFMFCNGIKKHLKVKVVSENSS